MRNRVLPEQIIESAIALVEETPDGLAGLSMRKLGERLHCEAMSLYHHFPSKAHLLNAMLDTLIATLGPPPTNGPWRERARNMCLTYRSLMRRYPKFAQYMLVHRMNTPATLRVVEDVSSVFLEAVHDLESAARWFRVVCYYLMGATLDETAGYASGPSAVEPLSIEEQKIIAPTLIDMGEYFAPTEWDKTFLRGLETLFDAMERESRMCEKKTPHSPRKRKKS